MSKLLEATIREMMNRIIEEEKSNAGTNALLKEGVFDPSILKAFFLAGGPGSGKSFISNKVTSGQGYKFINSDVFFEKLLRSANMSMDINSMTPDEYEAAMAMRARAKQSYNKAEETYLSGRLGVIYDGTGDDYTKIQGLKSKVELLGYDTYMIFVNTSLDVAKQRNLKRERSVPESLVINSWAAVQQNIGKFQNLFGNANFIIIDNDEYKEDILNKVWKQIRRISKSPVKNPLGKKWIDAEVESKKRLSILRKR